MPSSREECSTVAAHSRTVASINSIRWVTRTPKNGSEPGGAASRRSDLLLRRRRERVGGHLYGHRDVTVAQDLDRLTRPDGTSSDQVLDADRAALGEQLAEQGQVDHLILHAERVLETAQLRHPHMQRHLTALEVLRQSLPSTRSLGAAAGGLALRAAPPAHTSLRRLGAGSGAQMMDLQCHVRPPRRPPNATPS